MQRGSLPQTEGVICLTCMVAINDCRFESCPGHEYNRNIKHMNTFEQTKTEILRRAKGAGDYQPRHKARLEAQNAQELLKGITYNFLWAHNNRVIDASFLAGNFSKEDLDKAGIVLSKKTKSTAGRLYACGNALVNIHGHASVEAHDHASVEAYGNALVKAYDYASVKADGNASVEARGNASVKARGNASVEVNGHASVEAYGYASVRANDYASVEAYGYASVKANDHASVEAHGHASVEANGNASVEAYDHAYVLDYTGNIRNPVDKVIIRDCLHDRIYVRKGAFEIVEVE